MDQMLLYLLYFTLVLTGLLLFKGIFRHRLSARVQLWLWVILFSYLLLPVMPESPASVYNLLPNEASMASFAESIPNVSASQVAEPVLTPPLAVDHHDMIQDWLNRILPYLLLGGVWLLGVLALLVYFGAVYWSCLRKTRRLQPVTNADTLLAFENVKTRLGIKRKVCLLAGGETPMLVGILHPRILLPDGYNEKEQEAIFTHELSHLKHGDLFLLWAALLVLILHWYHPLAWVAHRTFRRDVETCCDQRVITLLENKKAYANLLLSTVLRKNRFVAGTTALQNGKKEVSRRIRYLAQFKKPGVWGGCGILVVGVILGVLLLTNADKTENNDVLEDNNVMIAATNSEEYQKIMAELAQAGANTIPNASYGWTFSIDSDYEFGELEYLASYVTGEAVDLHGTLAGMGILPSDYYGKDLYIRVDVVTSDDGSGIPHLCIIFPQRGDVLVHQLLTDEQEERLQRICFFAEKLHPKGGALEPISALYTLTKYELDDHFRITNEGGYVYREAKIDNWVEVGGGGLHRKANFTLKLYYEKELDQTDAPLTMEYEMQVQCDGQSVQLLRKYGGEWHQLALADFFPLRTLLAQSPMPH